MSDNGVWRTVSGRRVFIKDGENLLEAMSRSGKFDNVSEWHYPEYVEKTDLLEKEVENVRTNSRVAALRVSIDANLNIIQKELELIEQGKASGDTKVLISCRRRLRTARKKLIEKEIL